MAANVVAEQLPSRVMHAVFSEKQSIHEAHTSALADCEKVYKRPPATIIKMILGKYIIKGMKIE